MPTPTSDTSQVVRPNLRVCIPSSFSYRLLRA
jgi:hypothetical protein